MAEQSQWMSGTLRYEDPKHGNEMRIKLRGTFVAEGDGSNLPGGSTQSALATLSVPILLETVSRIHYADFPARRGDIGQALLAHLGPVFAQQGVRLTHIDVVEEVYDNPSFFEGFFKKAGPVLVTVGLVSMLLSAIGMNLKILLWIDAWGAGVGWLLRIAVVGVGVAFFLAGRAMSQRS